MKEYYEFGEFGELLGNLVYLSQQKNYTLALHLGYDVSYISKWITKSMLPANKNVQRICESIAQFIVQSTTLMQKQAIARFYKISENEVQDQLLYQTIRESLLTCYQYSIISSKHAEVPECLLPNSHFNVNPRLQRFSINHELPITQGLQDLIIFTNLFSMGKEDRLSIAGFDNSFDWDQKNPRIRIMISLTQFEQDLIFNSILLIHMIANYAEIDFKLYITEISPSSMMLAVRDLYCHTSILIENHRCIVSNTCTDKKLVNELYDTMEDVIKTQSNQAFEFMSMRQIIEDHYYMQSTISQSIRWLLGNITEQFLDNDLFEELLHQYIEDPLYKEDLKKNHMVMQQAVYASDTHIMLYESAIREFILDGKLDFFTIPIILDLQQRERVLQFLKKICSDAHYFSVRLIEYDFVEEFKQLNNQNLYISDNISYLRIENTSGNAIYMINNKEFMHAFSQFFEEIWNHRPDVTISCREVIEKKLDYHISCFDFFTTQKKE